MTETFQIVPAGTRPLWIFLPILLVLLAGVLVIARAASGANHSSVEVSPAGLRLRGDLYGRFIPAREIVIDSAAAVDLTAQPELRARIRTVGTALPGYQAGWFRLRNGEKALLYVTDPAHVVRIPTRKGYVVQLSVRDPAELVRALRIMHDRAGS